MRELVRAVFGSSQRVLGHRFCCQAFCKRGIAIDSSLADEGSSSQHWFSRALPSYASRDEMLSDLKNRILHEDGHLLVIDKPHGFPMHALKYSEHATPSESGFQPTWGLNEVVNEIAQQREEPDEISPSSSVSRLHSGVVVFSKTKYAQKILQKYFRHAQASNTLHHRYRAVALGSPQIKDPNSVETIFIERVKIGSNLLSVVKEGNKTHRMQRQQIRALFQLEILDSHSFPSDGSGPTHSVSLVEFKPSLGKWNAMECYFAHKLCPILGDHVYSSRVGTILGRKMMKNVLSCSPAPQVLPRPVLNSLSITERETASIPLHVHAYEIEIPDLSKKRGNLMTVSAPMPEFFNETLRRFNLQIPE